MGRTGGGSTTPRVGRYTSERRLIRNAGMTHETFWFRGHGPRASPMWKRTKVTIDIKINLASCLVGIAVLLSVLM